MPDFSTAPADREVDARILEHPFRVVRLEDSRLGCEKRAVETDGLREIFDADVDVESFHWEYLKSKCFHHEYRARWANVCELACLAYGAGALSRVDRSIAAAPEELFGGGREQKDRAHAARPCMSLCTIEQCTAEPAGTAFRHDRQRPQQRIPGRRSPGPTRPVGAEDTTRRRRNARARTPTDPMSAGLPNRSSRSAPDNMGPAEISNSGVCGIDPRAARPRLPDEPGPLQCLQMERK